LTAHSDGIVVAGGLVGLGSSGTLCTVLLDERGVPSE
jgi:hypothetical protein